VTAKEYLELAYKVDKAVQRRKEVAKKHRDSLYGRSIDYSEGNGVHNSNDALGEAIANVCSYEEETDTIIAFLVDTRFEIERTIGLLSNKMQKEVLTDRYLLYMPWKSKYDKDTGELIAKGIKEKTGYSSQAIFKFHSEGLKKISIPEKIRVNYSEIEKFL